ncbi:MAG: GNAT family N-acetyltransferase [Planctomycetota bacterium]
MTKTGPISPSTASDSGVIRVGPRERLEAAALLITGTAEARRHGARRLIDSASEHNIDLDLLWSWRRGDGSLSHTALAVPSAGRTAMVFLSDSGSSDAAANERQRCSLLARMRDDLAAERGDSVALLQALPEPGQPQHARAFTEAGWTRTGDLRYLRRPRRLAGERASAAALRIVDGLEVVPVGSIEVPDTRAALRAALERSYDGSLDCPELTGLRRTDDIIDSHASTGDFDPATWWLVYSKGEPEGCMLLNHVPKQQSAELVYLGLSPRLRGRGLGAKLLAMGIERVQRYPIEEIACAVDARNTPAQALYGRFGFTVFAERVAFVLPLSVGR